jgi:tetratricopeptide (TPR) repeat protein
VIEQILQADRLLQVDQVQQARDLYRRVVELDPGNAIAVVGLARCALADGDESKAHDLAMRALEIDPQNDMARRMEARLAEILATRGEPVNRAAPAAGSTKGELRPIVTDGGVHEVDGSPTLSTPTPEPRPAMRKTLIDRLLGR